MAKFKHRLFGCFDNIGLCLLTFFCPCYTFGRNAGAVGESCCLCALVFFIPVVDFVAMVSVRGQIRASRKIEGNILSDLLAVACCTFCALVQESQEIQTPVGQSIARS